MPQVRFQIKPGSAARMAEQEGTSRPAGPQGMSIRGGTAARNAEQARAEGEQQGTAAARRPLSPVMTMRATGGRPFRPEDERLHPSRVGQPAERVAAPVETTPAPANTGSGDRNSTKDKSMTGPFQSAVGRVESFLQTIFGSRASSPTRDGDPTL